MTILEMIKRVVEVVLLHIDDFVKGLIRAWDPDFTKVTPEERKRIDKADKEMKAGIYFNEEDVWN